MTTEYFRVRNGLLIGENKFTIDADTGDTVIEGNLTVNGTTTTINTQNLNVEDNFITLNYGTTGTPTLNAGIEVERGDQTNSAITWNESLGKWQQNRSGTSTVIPVSTTELSEGTNKYYNDTLVDAHLSGGTGVTYSSGVISIGQSVATTDAVTFGSVNIDSRVLLDTLILTTSATTADQVLDTFSAATYRTAKYIISITSGTDYQSVEMLVVHNGTTASQTTYADVATNGNLATFTVDISGGNVRLLTTPVNAVTAYKVTRTAIVV